MTENTFVRCYEGMIFCMIRLFVTDLDDTLLNAKKQVDQHNLDALAKLQQTGVQIAVASGRNEIEIDTVITNIPGNFHRICQNGAAVYVHTDECIYSSKFDVQLAKQLYRVGKAIGIPFFLSTSDQLYLSQEIISLTDHGDEIAAPLSYDPAIEKRIGVDLFPDKICFVGEQQELIAAKQQILADFKEEVDAFISGPHYLDIMPIGTNKGNGIRHLAEHLGIANDEIACIGDSENDLSMFHTIPHSFVMKVAKPSVQQKAKYPVESVAEAVERVLIWNKH
jgi:Cof subfamily protein (haloacid dehalogenase superfamily)